jgi:phytoene/squalene synthetase
MSDLAWRELESRFEQAEEEAGLLRVRVEQAEAAVARAHAAATKWHRDARELSERIDQRDRPEWVMVAHVCAVVLAALDGKETDHGA